MASVTILIAVYYELVRDGIEKLLDGQSGLSVADTVQNSKELASYDFPGGADLLVLDLDMPDLDARNFIHGLRREHPDVHVLALSDQADAETARAVMRVGASGYMMKKRGVEDLVKAIENIAGGGQYVCDDTLRLLIQQSGTSHDGALESDILTDREMEVLREICGELTNKEIAEKLSISVRTVDAHRRNLLQKTGARNTAGLVKYAIKHGLYEP
ncbi:MAG: response regulator transcription factor [Balneolaceae bacterium]|nr:response regulator transcription factor [Balneolaceae bacterium]